MTDEELIKRLRAYAQIEHAAAPWGFAGEGEVLSIAADRIAALPTVTVRYTQADIGKIAAIIAEDDPFGVGAAAIAKAGCILAALEPVAAPDLAAIREAVLALRRHIVSMPHGDQEAVLLSDALRVIEEGRG